VWGLIHGFFLILFQWQKQPRKKLFKKIGIKNSNSFVVFIETILTLFIVLIAWVFFRSDSIAQSFAYLGKMFSSPSFEIPSGALIMNLFWVALLLIAEWIQRDKQHALQFGKFPVFARWAVYYALVILIIFMGGKQETFIYFQF